MWAEVYQAEGSAVTGGLSTETVPELPPEMRLENYSSVLCAILLHVTL